VDRGNGIVAVNDDRSDGDTTTSFLDHDDADQPVA
jgi:hypothetical protein